MSPVSRPRSVLEKHASPKNSCTFLGVDSDGNARFKKSSQFDVPRTLSTEEREKAWAGEAPPPDHSAALEEEPPTELETLSYSPAQTAQAILPLEPNLDESPAPTAQPILPLDPNLDESPAPTAQPTQPVATPSPSTYIRRNLRQAPRKQTPQEVLLEEHKEKAKKVEVTLFPMSDATCLDTHP